MYQRKEDLKEKGLSLKGTVPNVLSVIMVISLFIFAPRNLGAFYLPTADSENSAKVMGAYPVDKPQFRQPVLASDNNPFEHVIEMDGRLYWLDTSAGNPQPGKHYTQVLIPLSPQEIAAYHQYKKGTQIELNSQESPLKNNPPQVAQSPTRRPNPALDEPQKQLPPGVEKQGDQKQADKGKHSGWQIGNHYGWDKKAETPSIRQKKSENNSQGTNNTLELTLASHSKKPSLRRIKLEDNPGKEKPKLNLENLPKPIDKKEDASPGLPKINELKLESNKSLRTPQTKGPQDRIMIQSLPTDVR